MISHQLLHTHTHTQAHTSTQCVWVCMHTQLRGAEKQLAKMELSNVKILM